MIRQLQILMIYIVTHKDKQLPEVNATPILVGNAKVDNIDLKVRDYYPTISDLNVWYGEVESYYYIRNFDNDKVKGQYSYRRIITNTSIPDEFDGIAVPVKVDGSVYAQYCYCHIKENIDNCRDILLDLYPEYDKAWQEYIVQGTELYYGGGFILKGAEYDKYVTWLFSILDEIKTRYHIQTMDDVRDYVSSKTNQNIDYQCRFGGFLAERLTTLYFKNNLKIKESNYLLL